MMRPRVHSSQMHFTTFSTALLFCFLCLVADLHGGGGAASTAGNPDGTERWGYVRVRPKANLFWWWFKSPQRESSSPKPWPTILWLQGGPGGSGSGRGNFQEIGPLDENLQPRNSTWLSKADIIFVDSPVGVGYSYVEDPSALAKTDWQAAMDVVELIKTLVRELPTLLTSPLYLVGESYGGKLAAMIGVAVARSIRDGSLNITLGGVVLGDAWISPEDFSVSYPWLLQSMSRIDDNAMSAAIRMGITVKQQMEEKQFTAAYKTWTDLLALITLRSGQVDMENILNDNTVSPVPSNLYKRSSGGSQATGSDPNTISGIMNGVVRHKLKIIPKFVIWQEVSLDAFVALKNNFMRPAINEVDELLKFGVNVTVYNGQLDIICSTIGAESWLKKLKWSGLYKFLSLPRRTLSYCDVCEPYYHADAFVRSYKNLNFYWVLGAGHSVPVDQPCAAVQMIGDVLQSPAS